MLTSKILSRARHAVVMLVIGLAGLTAHAGTIADGDADTRANLARSAFGVDGSGLTIGIISDSFNVSGSGGAVPTVNVIQEGFATGNPWGQPVGTDQGRAMAEVIHHVAPGASLLFHAASNSPDPDDFTAGPSGALPASSDAGDVYKPKPSSLVTAIESLVAAGADIIVNDSGYFNEPWFQNGQVANAVTAAYNGTLPGSGGKRVPVITSAGHFGAQSWEGQLINSNYNAGFPVGSRAGTYNQFDTPLTLDNLQLSVTLEPGESITAAMQWSEPFPLGGSTAYDLDLFLTTGTSPFGTKLAGSERIQVNPGGGNGDWDADGEPDYDPWELLSFTNETGSNIDARLLVKIAVDGHAVTDPTIKIIVAGDDVDLDLDNNATNSPTVVGHGGAAGALSIGTLMENLYTFGVTGVGTPVDDNSSVGAHQVLFDQVGNPIVVPAQSPDLVGPDGVTTSFFTFDPGSDYDGQRYYDGVSAAAAYVAGAAALILEKADDLGMAMDPDELYAYLMNHAVNLADPAQPDLTSGFGMIDIHGAVSDLPGIPEPATGLILAGVAFGMLGHRRQ